MSLPLRPSQHRPDWPVVVVVCSFLVAHSAAAQEQERSLRDRIERPDMGMTAQGFDRAFTTGSTGANKSFAGRLFGFGRAASIKGDGRFQTHAFDGKGYQASGFATKKSSLTDQTAGLSDRTFESKTVAIQSDRAANKKAETQLYHPSDKPFISHGKRQDEFDELRRKKHLSIDEVRELLNKNK